MDPDRFAYVAAGAGDDDVREENVRALNRWRLVPRVLKYQASQSTSTEVIGIEVGAPIMLAPIRGLDYVRSQGQKACAQAAAECGVPLILSNLASSSIEEVAAVLGSTPRFLQLYPCSDTELIQSFVGRAERAAYSALVLTVDTSGHPIQYRGPVSSDYQDFGHEIYLSDPVFQSRLKLPATKDRKAAMEMIRKVRDAVFTWEDVDRIHKSTRLPIFLKGILSPLDAKEALNHEVNGLVVSNHGGRTMGGEVASIDMLPEIGEASDMKLTLLYDGGIRSGVDVLKALALGAKAVLVGRAYVYGLASDGQDGVASVIKTMLKEMKSGLATCGCSSVKELNMSYVKRSL